jgi:hypothetical protein
VVVKEWFNYMFIITLLFDLLDLSRPLWLESLLWFDDYLEC